jgi:hypothetical protein
MAGVRIPLQLGHSAALGRLRANALFVPSLVMTFAWVAVPGWLGERFGTPMGYVGLPLGFAVGVLAVIGMAFAATGSDDAQRQAPSDLFLDEAGVLVRGGPHDGVRLRWSEVADTTVTPREDSEAGAVLRMLAGLLRVLQLRGLAERMHARVVQLRVGERVLGEAVRRPEVQSLRSLGQTLVGIAAARARPEPETTDVGTEVVRCDDCGSPALPADRAQTECVACGNTVDMPESVRGRIRAHAQSRGGERLAQVIARVLDQPDARAAQRWLARGGWVMRSAWPLGLATLVTLAIAHAIVPDENPRIVLVEAVPSGFPWRTDLGLSTLVVAGLLVAAAFALDAYFANRRALRLLTLDFGAAPPTIAGGAWSCRACAGPLPSGPRVLVTCAYCEADNVLGIDLRLHARRVQAHTRSVAGALRHRRRARIRLVLVFGVLTGGAVVLGQQLRSAFLRARPRTELQTACFMCNSTQVRNEDAREHLVRVSAEQGTHARMVPAGAEVDVECDYDCELHLGDQAVPLRRPARASMGSGRLSIRDGRIVPR